MASHAMNRPARISVFSDQRRHQLGQNLVLGLDFLLQVGDALLLGRIVGSPPLLKDSRPVLEELLLPAVEDGRFQSISSHSFETGSFSSRCRRRMATFLPVCRACVASSCVRSVIL